MVVSIYQRNQSEMGGLLPAKAIASPANPVQTENQMVFESSDLLWGRKRSNNNGPAEPRRLQLAITNEGSIDLHKVPRLQTNFLFPYISTMFPAIGEGPGKQTGRVR